jgi:hypothetical protein
MAGYELFARWERDEAILRAEFVGGRVGLTFTGRVIYHSLTELRLARFDDVMSISLLFGELKFFNEVEGHAAAVAHFRDNYVCGVRIITDAGASCVIYELRKAELTNSVCG